MRTPTNVTVVVRAAVRVAIVVAGLASLGACASIPHRAWANGEAMTQSRAYNAVLNGNQSIQAHHELMWSLNPRKLNFRETPYSPFGNWWY